MHAVMEAGRTLGGVGVAGVWTAVRVYRCAVPAGLCAVQLFVVYVFALVVRLLHGQTVLRGTQPLGSSRNHSHQQRCDATIALKLTLHATWQCTLPGSMRPSQPHCHETRCSTATQTRRAQRACSDLPLVWSERHGTQKHSTALLSSQQASFDAGGAYRDVGKGVKSPIVLEEGSRRHIYNRIEV